MGRVTAMIVGFVGMDLGGRRRRAGLAMPVGEAELAQPIQGVLQRPHLNDPAVAEPEDPDLIIPFGDLQ
jgi:hypothetical protein